ncbi:MAG: TonB-dependent receptor [Acidobacteria bacterium]|nr:TonB-dependent receptor [Acidobacteriota bacterium]MCA1649495.1 TonB-dependent receptor [Acidobacteriota bacterium]
MHLRLASVLIVIMLAPAFVPGAGAQTTGTISGTVQDSSGAILPGVIVTVRNEGTGYVRSAVTGAEGRYTVPALPPGGYEVRGELAGFKPQLRRNLSLVIGETLALNITLQLGALEVEEVVVGTMPLVNTSSSELSYLVGSQAIEQLPLNGRNYTDLALLQPGVNAFPHRDGGSVVAHGLAMSVNGQDPRSNVYLLDGTLQNDITNGPAGSAAGTALGMETIREFRVEANAYSAEFGRNSGGQINVLTKSGTNRASGSLFEFHRNDALDAKNYFDAGGKPDFHRNQFGATFGGPLAKDRAFFFFGYEALVERLGRTINTFVPDDNARRGILPDPTNPGGTITIPIDAAVAPYLAEFPRANGPVLGEGIATLNFPFQQKLDEHFFQGRIDYNLGANQQFFGRYTFDDADQFLPTDYPQFPRNFISRNQFFTGEYRRVLSTNTLNTARLGFSRTTIGQNVQANTSQTLPTFVPGRDSMGDIDIGGLRRFGPQSSANLRLVQNVFSLQNDLVHTRGRHVTKAGALVERYQDNMVNPTFSLGIFAFPSLTAFLQNRPNNFVGLTPEAQFDRYWRFTLFGLYAQDDYQITPRLTVNAGLRYEFTTMPQDKYNRDSSLPDLTAAAPTVGPLYENPTYTNLSPRVGFAWDPFGDGRTSVRGGYGLYYNTNNQQNLIVTVTNPPATPRPVIMNPTFPNPPFDRAGAISIRPVQFDLENPRVHVYNVNVQRELWWRTALTVGYAGSRGMHLLRSGDVNTAVPTTLADGTLFIPANTPRRNRSFSTIELKSSDGDSWYNALVVDLRRRWSGGFALQSSYTLSKSEDTTQASTFFSDATNGTTSAFPEEVPDYNKGLSDFDSRHTWVVNLTWDLPFARGLSGPAGALLDGWQISGIWNMRSGNPLTVFVQSNRSRSQWNPSRGPGIGQDRPSYAPGYGSDNAVLGQPDQWFDPKALVLQPAGTFGNTGRGDFIGPNLRTVDLALSKTARWTTFGGGGRLEFRLEAFNVLNRANFGVPSLTAFAGQRDDEVPFATFGRISNTVTSARQIQLGIRVAF